MSDTATAPEPATTSPSPASPGASRGRLASHAAIYTVATAAPALAALLVLPFITRLLPEDEMNLVSLGNQVIQVGLILVALGRAAAIPRESSLAGPGPEGARGLVMQSAVICVAITALGLTSGPLWVPLIMDAPWSWPFAWAVLAALGGSLVFVSQSYLRGAERPMAFVALAAGGTLLGPALGLGAVATLEATATADPACAAGGYPAAGPPGVR
ncbi:MAG: hypothetical protein FWG11_07770, partial [Promicromonosporaceae bacterium]|nr:hypothetical protein [Promicromonosporaceae bacterium]